MRDICIESFYSEMQDPYEGADYAELFERVEDIEEDEDKKCPICKVGDSTDNLQVCGKCQIELLKTI
jgi:hypothetical protein